MPHTLPNYEEVGCPRIQARRVWEVWKSCKDKSTHNVSVHPDGRYIAVRDTAVKATYLVFPDGDVYIRMTGSYPNPPPPMPGEEVKNNTEYCRALANAIQMACSYRFPLEASDVAILNDAVEKKTATKLELLLDRVLSGDCYESLVSLFQALKRDVRKEEVRESVVSAPTAQCDTYEDGVRTGKILVIKEVWKARFHHPIATDQVLILESAHRRNVDSLNHLLRLLATPGKPVEPILAEMRKLAKANDEYWTAQGK